MIRAVAVLLALGACGSEVVIEPPVTVQRAIIDGSTDMLHDGVVAMVTRSGRLRCSGTVIHERVVLTAAHCAAGIDVDAYRIAFGVEGSDDPAVIEEGYVHPGWPANRTHDLALLALVEPVPSTVSVHRFADPLGDPTAVGIDVEVVGFGREDSQTGGAGTRRSGDARITIVEDLQFAFDPTPSSVCFGDSGGPTFASVGAGDDVIGVHSRTLDAQCEMRGFDVRVAAYAEDFIRPYLEEIDRPTTSGNPKSCDCRTSGLSSALALAVFSAWLRRRKSVERATKHVPEHAAK